MPRFRYRASAPDGRIAEGTATAADLNAVHGMLRRENLFPISIAAEEKAGRILKEPVLSRASGFTQRISLAELAEIASQLAKLVAADLPILSVASEMEALASRKAIASAWNDIRQDIRGGKSLSEAMRRQSSLFPAYFTEMVAAGEESGHLGAVLERLADHLAGQSALQADLMAALVYPAIMVILASACVGFLLVGVLPRFAEVFAEMERDLPLPTLLLLEFSAWLNRVWLWALEAALASGFLLWRLARLPRIRFALHRRFPSVPVFGGIHRDSEAARFSRALSTLLRGGVPLLKALEVLARTLRNIAMSEAVDSARERVSKGEPLSQALEGAHFPGLLIRMIMAGEATSSLPDMLERSAVIFEHRVRNRSRTLLTLLEPAVIIVMAVLVTFIFASVLLPLIRMTEI